MYRSLRWSSAATLVLSLTALHGAFAQTAPAAQAAPAATAQPAPTAAQPAPVPAPPLAVAPQAAQPAPQAQPAQPLPSNAKLPNGEYTAPMAQTSQPSYVPQSVALSGPDTIEDWDPSRPIPAGYHEETRKRKGLIISGAITFGAAYLISAFTASVGADTDSGHNNEAALYVPVFGPFAQWSNWSSSTGRFFLVIDGGCQVAGVAMALTGLLMDKSILVRNDLGVSLVPIHTRDGGNGLGLYASF